MKPQLLIVFLFCFSLNAQPADPLNKPTRSLVIGVETGLNQSFAQSKGPVNNLVLMAKPLLSLPFNHFSISAELSPLKNPDLLVSIGIGYQVLRTAYGEPGQSFSSKRYFDGPEIPSLFLDPGLKWRLPLGERWAALPGLSFTFHRVLKEKEQPYSELAYSISETFTTINPSLEFRMHLDGAFYGSLFGEYQQGVSTAARLFLKESGTEVLGEYRGSGLLVGVKLSYCLPCRG